MSQHRPEHLDLCAALSVGAIDGADREVLDAHLAEGCEECDRALRDFSGAMLLLAAGSPAAQPRPELRAKVLDAVRAAGAPVAVELLSKGSPAPASPVLRMPPASGGRATTSMAWTAWAAWAAAASLAVVAALGWRAASRSEGELGMTRVQLVTAESQLAVIEERAREQQRLLEVLSAPEARIAQIALTPDGMRELRGRATFDPKSRSAVLTFANMTAPAGRDYQLWALRDGGVVSLGLIQADAAGDAILRLDDLGDPATLGGFAVSLEPAGGSPNPLAPSGPVVMAGQFGA